MAIHLRPDGRLTLAASHIKAFDAAQETSRVFSILKCQVKVPFANMRGRLANFIRIDDHYRFIAAAGFLHSFLLCFG
jgi:hypothetical protein